MLKRTLPLLLLALLAVCSTRGQQPKMSAYVRQIAAKSSLRQAGQPALTRKQSSAEPADERQLCTFVRVGEAEAADVFSRHDCRSLAHWGDIHIVMMPLANLRALASEKSVSRIEAGPSAMAAMDSTALRVNALPVYDGWGLPQAYTGKGVIVGVVDIGFDLTHPNFFSPDLTKYRISRLWDQLAPDSLGESLMPVGREIVGQEALLSYGCSYDGRIETHGTHTLGTAAGSGFDSPYRGMAWESDVCLVANATSDNAELIDSLDQYKYTTATDALAFKYVFDYAQQQQRPCVLSFSEGSAQYFDDDQQLFYAVLDSLTGPGRIMVAAAGNWGATSMYMHKPRGQESAGAYLRSASADALMTLRSDEPYQLRMVVYADREHPDTLTFDPIAAYSDSTRLEPDSLTGVLIYTDSLIAANGTYVYKIARYPSCYNEQDTVSEVLLTAPATYTLGEFRARVSIELLGEQADVECFVSHDKFTDPGDDYPVHNDNELTHSVMSPGAAPAVICVGAVVSRTSYVNFRGTLKRNNIDYGKPGYWASYSSIGPTVDGRIKPDVTAPGGHTISSNSSFYYEAHPQSSITNATVEIFEHNGRKYLWTTDIGTSMATPVVAGAIALWLQAKPTLTPEEALDILASTSTQPDKLLSYPNNYYGHGVVDVYRGMLQVLGLTAIRGLSQQQPSQVQVRPQDGRALLVSATGSEWPRALTVYNLAGRQVWKGRVPRSGDGQSRVSLPQLPPGVYAVQLHGDSPASNGSTLVRLE